MYQGNIACSEYLVDRGLEYDDIQDLTRFKIGAELIADTVAQHNSCQEEKQQKNNEYQ